MGHQAVFFTHIPKTGGTSLNHSLLLNKFDEHDIQRSKGIRNLWESTSHFKYHPGHHPYGIHWFSSMSDEPIYVTMLRHPVKRAISFYYECLWPRGGKKVADHPDHPIAWKHDIVDFYRIPRFQNVQARMIAGILPSILGRYVSLDRLAIGDCIVQQAKYNLAHNYRAFGITSRFSESRKLIANALGWSEIAPIEKKHKTNHDRPKIIDFSVEEIKELERLNGLDMKVYQYATEHFERQPHFVA